MPLVYGQAVSYSPLIYRPRNQWPAVYAALVGDVVQPATADNENDIRLDAYERRVHDAFWLAGERLNAQGLDALIVLVADDRRMFDDSNSPQLHVFAGPEIWGDPALSALGEAATRHAFRCAPAMAARLAEELTRAGFDISETSGAFEPAGDPTRGAVAALVEPLTRFDLDLPIIPIHINCRLDPAPSASRVAHFGAALAHLLATSPQRVGMLVSGGLSGQPGDAMAGWIDEVLDTWVLARLALGLSSDLGRIFEVQSQTLRGSTGEIRLWAAAGAACEAAALRASADEYVPLHHAATGIGFMHWES